MQMTMTNEINEFEMSIQLFVGLDYIEDQQSRKIVYYTHRAYVTRLCLSRNGESIFSLRHLLSLLLYKVPVFLCIIVSENCKFIDKRLENLKNLARISPCNIMLCQFLFKTVHHLPWPLAQMNTYQFGHCTCTSNLQEIWYVHTYIYMYVTRAWFPFFFFLLHFQMQSKRHVTRHHARTSTYTFPFLISDDRTVSNFFHNIFLRFPISFGPGEHYFSRYSLSSFRQYVHGRWNKGERAAANDSAFRSVRLESYVQSSAREVDKWWLIAQHGVEL